MPKISKINLAASILGLMLLFTLVSAGVNWMSVEKDTLPAIIGMNSIAFVFAIATWNGTFDLKNEEPTPWLGWLFIFLFGVAMSLLFLALDCGGHLPAFHPVFVCNGNPGISLKSTLGALGITVIALPTALRAFIIEKFDGKL